MNIIIHKDTNVVKYINQTLTSEGIFWKGGYDKTLTTENALEFEVDVIPIDLRGGYYTYTIEEGFLQTPLGEEAFIEAQKEAQRNLKLNCESAINELIQSKIDAYNEENLLSLTNIYSCAHYSGVQGYTHQAFCNAVWIWSVSVWEKARESLGQALEGTLEIDTPQDVIVLLPEFTFEGN